MPRPYTVALLLLASPCLAQQLPDTAFTPALTSPDYATGKGPSVLIDAAHVNFHTADGGYQSFARLLRRDGFRVASNVLPFTATSLANADILVIANAMHRESEADFAPLPNHSAFTEAEISAVEQWVRSGGALFLIADHMPLAGHAEALAAAFGIRFQNGFALDSAGSGRVTFRRAEGTLPSSVIANGRHADERVDSVTSFTGQAFRLDPDIDADPVLVLTDAYTLLLPRVAWQFSDSTPRIPAANLLQGAIVQHGQGRLAVFGEAAMFTAQRAGPQQLPVGMNDPSAPQNYRLMLNVMHWLSARDPS